MQALLIPASVDADLSPNLEHQPQTGVTPLPLVAALASAPTALPFRRQAMTAMPGGYDEKWLQELLFAHPALIPLDRIEIGAGGAGEVVPLCRELTLSREGGVVYLDLLCVTRAGRLMLIECKLWRNPQARREVVAQILEYASLLKGWSYGDLTARLKQQRKWQGANPIFDHAAKTWADLDEARFVDAVSHSLASGDFHLVIAGDGIRSDVEALANHINSGHMGPARLSLVEIQLWRSQSGETMVVPFVPTRTEVIESRVIVTEDGRALPVKDVRVDGMLVGKAADRDRASSDADAVVDPDRAAQRDRNKAFWDHFIDTTRFDHPDQLPASHGGNNWVRIPLEAPIRWLTAYRASNNVMGIFARLTDEPGRQLAAMIEDQLRGMRAESGLDLQVKIQTEEPFKAELGVTTPMTDRTEEQQLGWLAETANRMVTLLRPKLSAWNALRDGDTVGA
ncbi:hypothetical protein [Rhizobium sp. Root482]|uniref:hypothetical protein n=1 Tax=Rhizobium sp. Root482 TaxID=1736543 RepID=UPI000702132E|nr:hypothetical protein [Rhizobium sp. Root482]KQY11199.1 hypothetical protein ASD31_17540 [Rhizobium sp. Root482]